MHSLLAIRRLFCFYIFFNFFFWHLQLYCRFTAAILVLYLCFTAALLATWRSMTSLLAIRRRFFGEFHSNAINAFSACSSTLLSLLGGLCRAHTSVRYLHA